MQQWVQIGTDVHMAVSESGTESVQSNLGVDISGFFCKLERLYITVYVGQVPKTLIPFKGARTVASNRIPTG